MNREIRCLANMLAEAGGWQAAATPSAGVRWDRWAEHLEEQQVGPYLHARCRPTWNLPAEARTAMALFYGRNAGNAMCQARELDRIASALSGFDVVLLKGASLIGSLYAEAAEREMQDLDLLLRTRDEAVAAREILRERGYVVRKVMHAHHHLSPLIHPLRGVSVELHYNIWTPALPDAVMTDLWNQTREESLPSGAAVRVLAPAAQVVHLACHAMADPIESPLLRNLFEVAALVTALDPEERAQVVALSIEWSLDDLAARSLWLAHDLFGSPALFARPRPGFFEGWSRERLRWRTYDRASTRLKRHVAVKHFDRLVGTRAHRNPLPLLGILWKAAGRNLRARAGRPSSPKINPQRKDLFAEPCGEELLLLDRRTNEAHVLQSPASEIWQRADGTRSLSSLREELVDEGHGVDRIRHAISLLARKELVSFEA